MYFVSCPKQGLKIELEVVVLHRVVILEYFCPGVTPIPKHGSSNLPPDSPATQEVKPLVEIADRLFTQSVRSIQAYHLLHAPSKEISTLGSSRVNKIHRTCAL